MTEQDFRKKVYNCVMERQLSSVMNNTKWINLQSAVLNILPFPPPYQAKYVLDNIPYPEKFDNNVGYFGDWVEGLGPFYSVEWIRVRPRYQRHQGNLLPPEVIDITNEFIDILIENKVPFIDVNDSIYIYGYISSNEKYEFKYNK